MLAGYPRSRARSGTSTSVSCTTSRQRSGRGGHDVRRTDSPRCELVDDIYRARCPHGEPTGRTAAKRAVNGTAYGQGCSGTIAATTGACPGGVRQPLRTRRRGARAGRPPTRPSAGPGARIDRVASSASPRSPGAGASSTGATRCGSAAGSWAPCSASTPATSEPLQRADRRLIPGDRAPSWISVRRHGVHPLRRGDDPRGGRHRWQRVADR